MYIMKAIFPLPIYLQYKLLYAREIILICDSIYNNNAENWVNYINSYAFIIIL